MSSTTLVTLKGKAYSELLSDFIQLLDQNQIVISNLKFTLNNDEVQVSFVFPDLFLKFLEEYASFRKLSVQTSSYVMSESTAESYVLRCVGVKGINLNFLSDLSAVLGEKKLSVQRMRKLSHRSLKALELSLSCAKVVDPMQMKMDFMRISNLHGVDTLFDEAGRSEKKLFVFDMDSTLIQHEVIDEMAAEFGIGDKVAHITERAMNGELNFDQSLRERVSYLKGFEKDKMQKIFDRLRLTPGTEAFLKKIHSLGHKTAIVSGGFRFFAENLQKKMGMTYAFANELEWEGNTLTGRVTGEVVNAAKKAALLEELAVKEKLSLDQVVAIGDGANDLPMLARAGLGIAFHAKEKVRQESRHLLSHGPMTSILYYLGIPGDHLE